MSELTFASVFRVEHVFEFVGQTVVEFEVGVEGDVLEAKIYAETVADRGHGGVGGFAVERVSFLVLIFLL